MKLLTLIGMLFIGMACTTFDFYEVKEANMMKILTNRDKKICYETIGDSSNPAILLVSGITAQMTSWPRDFLTRLSEVGFFVVIFDNRDVGLSQYYDHLPTPEFNDVIAALQEGEPIDLPYSLEDMADDIGSLLDGLKIQKAIVVGMSMGGMIAQIFSTKFPHRTIGLVGVATSPGDQDLPQSKPEVMTFLKSKNSSTQGKQDQMEKHIAQYRLYSPGLEINEREVRASFKAQYSRAYHPEGNKRQMLAMFTNAPRGQKLRNLKISALVLHGDVDPVFPLDHGTRLAERLRCELIVIENMGHVLTGKAYFKLVDEIKSKWGSE